MKVQFEWETFYEDDSSWDALFVKVNDKWLMAMPNFGTEDEKEILSKLNECD